MTRSRDVADTQDNLGGAVAPFVAGKNKAINADFGIWQRGTSINLGYGLTRCSDKWYVNSDSSLTGTSSRQAFTPGSAPSSGYEFAYFMRQNITAVSGGTFIVIAGQDIEDVRTFAGQTITVSFWAKADTTRTYGVSYQQQFGTGGSSPVYGGAVNVTVGTSWARYSVNIAVPSIAGKTIGTGSYFLLYILATAVTAQTFDIAGIQPEVGNVATPFTPAGGGFPGAELALCFPYLQRFLMVGNLAQIGFGQAVTSSIFDIRLPLFTPLRSGANALDVSGIAVYDPIAAVGYTGGTWTIANNDNTGVVARYTHTSAAFTTGRMMYPYGGAGFIRVGSEL